MTKRSGWYRFGQVVGIVFGVIVGHTLINIAFGPRQSRPNDYGNQYNSQLVHQANTQPIGVFEQALAMSMQNTNQNYQNRA